MATEIERKFLIDVESDEFKSLKPVRFLVISQAYIAKTDDLTFRIRSTSEFDSAAFMRRIGKNVRTLGIKGKRFGNMCSEYEYVISEEDASKLIAETNAIEISKERIIYEYKHHHIEVDKFFNEELDGLVMAEIEFNSFDESEEFIPPAWLGKEVSDDPAYTNRFLSERLGIKD